MMMMMMMMMMYNVCSNKSTSSTIRFDPKKTHISNGGGSFHVPSPGDSGTDIVRLTLSLSLSVSHSVSLYLFLRVSSVSSVFGVGRSAIRLGSLFVFFVFFSGRKFISAPDFSFPSNDPGVNVYAAAISVRYYSRPARQPTKNNKKKETGVARAVSSKFRQKTSTDGASGHDDDSDRQH